MGDEEENDDNIVGKEYPGGRVGLNCRVIKEEDKVIVEEINHGFINDGYDDVLYEANGENKILSNWLTNRKFELFGRSLAFNKTARQRCLDHRFCSIQ